MFLRPSRRTLNVHNRHAWERGKLNSGNVGSYVKSSPSISHKAQGPFPPYAVSVTLPTTTLCLPFPPPWTVPSSLEHPSTARPCQAVLTVAVKMMLSEALGRGRGLRSMPVGRPVPHALTDVNCNHKTTGSLRGPSLPQQWDMPTRPQQAPASLSHVTLKTSWKVPC